MSARYLVYEGSGSTLEEAAADAAAGYVYDRPDLAGSLTVRIRGRIIEHTVEVDLNKPSGRAPTVYHHIKLEV